MATLADLRTRVLSNLYSAEPAAHPLYQQNNGAIATDSTPTIPVDTGTNFSLGNIIEFQDNGEQCYVISVAGNNLTVIRGFNGTTAATHADNTVIAKNPRFTVKQTEDSITQVLYALEGQGVHVFGQGSLTLVDNVHFYDIAETDLVPMYGVLSVHYEDTTVDTRIMPLPFYRDMVHTSISASQQAIRLLSWGTQNAGDTVYYAYAKKIDGVDDLLPRQEELVVLGATAKMAGKTLFPRTQDPGKHTDRTVQPGQGMRDGRWYQGEFYLSVKAEAAQLAVEREQFAARHNSARSRRWRW